MACVTCFAAMDEIKFMMTEKKFIAFPASLLQNWTREKVFQTTKNYGCSGWWAHKDWQECESVTHGQDTQMWVSHITVFTEYSSVSCAQKVFFSKTAAGHCISSVIQMYIWANNVHNWLFSLTADIPINLLTYFLNIKSHHEINYAIARFTTCSFLRL